MKDKLVYIVGSEESSEMLNIISGIRNHFEEYKKTFVKIQMFSKTEKGEFNHTLEHKNKIHSISDEVKKYFGRLKKWDVMFVRIESVKVLEKV